MHEWHLGYVKPELIVELNSFVEQVWANELRRHQLTQVYMCMLLSCRGIMC